ncbi:hypothetical protein NX059_000506 [Plenodomus lindquistii]|nr:hypothetical protein NX059_000506 [Plenodomus lindquistii]
MADSIADANPPPAGADAVTSLHPPPPRADSVEESDHGTPTRDGAEELLPDIPDFTQEPRNDGNGESSTIDKRLKQDSIQESVENDMESQPSRTNPTQPDDLMPDITDGPEAEDEVDSLYEDPPTGSLAGGPEDSSTLFVSENSSSPPSLPPPSPPPPSPPPPPPPVTQKPSVFKAMPNPARLPTQSRLGNPTHKASVFSTMRDMQAKLKRKRELTNRQATDHTSNIQPDNETYLEAVTQGRMPVVPAGVPLVDEDTLDDRRASAEFQKQKRHYEKLKREGGGKLGFRQDIEWMKIKGAEDARQRKRARDIAKSLEDGEGDEGFLPAVHSTQQERPEDESDHDFDWDGPGSRKRARRDAPHRSGKHMSMLDAELQSMQVGIEAIKEVSAKKGKEKAVDNSPATDSRSKGAKSKARSKPSQAKGAPKTTRAKSAKHKREVEQAIKQASSLFNANVFTQQAGPDAAEQPGFTSRRKGDALKELIASIPLDEKKSARGEMNILLNATKEFDGRGSVKAVPGTNLWLVKGMKTSLKHYQVLGSAFMRRRENSVEEPRGGLLADQMGLGKTLMMLANIVNGQPAKNSRELKTTLLVASPALLSQWKNEIELHTDKDLKIMRYGAGNRIDSTNAFDILRAHDIVLTSYAEVMKSFPKSDPPVQYQTVQQKMAWWEQAWEQNRGVLHRMTFLRVVLDEAQAIKNHMGRTSMACRALKATHKWALSGTPIMNSLTELYPYFKFLNVPHTGSFKIFKHNYCDTKDPENTERLLVRLSSFMLRRTHADEMFGAPILKLPQADQDTYWCEFNPVERCIYDIVQARFAKRINVLSQRNELEKSYSNALVMLLRLRQLTSHVLMLQFVMEDLLEREDIERIKEITKEHSADTSTQSGQTILAIRKQLELHATRSKKKRIAVDKAKAEAKAAGREYREDYVSEDEDEDEAPHDEDGAPEAGESSRQGGQKDFSGGLFGTEYNFKPFLKNLESGDSWEKVKKRSRCAWCSKQPVRPWITSCGHLICGKPCVEEANDEAMDAGKLNAACKACGVTPTYMHPCEPDDTETPEAVARGTRSQAAKKKNKQRTRLEREDIGAEWLSSLGDNVLPSAKTIAIKAQILNWTKTDPQVKIIIYTQFIAMIRIMAKVCQNEGWKIEEYHGGMSLPARDKAIASFAENSNTRIMLASLRCGGLGLNLTMASKVIMMDPWWNSASEQQAFCRVFRIGQKEETFMSRICVKNTVDQQLINMQKRKDAEIEAVMEDGGKTKSKMSIRDLMRLFGNLDDDSEGRPFIMVDNPDPRGGFRADRDDEGYADEF